MKRFTVLLAFLVFAGLQLLQAQAVQITGNVTTAEDGSPLPGVSVVVKGTTIGTVTNYEGNFTLAVPEDAETLVFSFIGMRTQEVAIDDKTTISVVLSPDVVGLDEVVVTAIGIRKEAKALGYAVQEVDADAIEKSGQTNVINALSGKVAGVRINRASGEAGASSFIEIRGSSSLLFNNQPLFIVDGVPIDNSGNTGNTVDGVAESNRAIDLNPDDIESISVLKGGQATALYGIRAANGAIIVTTKSGQRTAEGKINVNYHFSARNEQISQMPELQRKYAQGSRIYSDLLNFYYGDVTAPIDHPDQWYYKGVSWGPDVSELRYTTDENYVPANDYPWEGETPMNVWLENWDPNGRMVFADHPLAGSQVVKTYDHYDFFEKPWSFKHHLDISGGDEKSTFYLSAARDDNKGIVPNNEFSKTSFKFSGTTTVAKGLTVGASANYINSEGMRLQKGSNISGIMLGLLRTPPTFDNSYKYQLPDGSQRSYRGGGGYDNPYWTVNKNQYNDNVDRLIGNINLNWRANDWLSFTYRLGVDKWYKDVKYFFEKGSNQYADGYLTSTNSTNNEINSDLLMTIQRNLGADASFNFTLGQNLYQSQFESSTAEANGLDALGFYSMTNTSDNRGYENNSKYRTAAFFGDLGFDWKSMLFLNFTGRYEWSTSLPEENNAFFYPSAGIGFVFTEIPALKDNNILSFGKLRASFATIANDAPIFATRTRYFQPFITDGWLSPDGIPFPYQNVNAFYLSGTLGNSQIEPEKSTTWEVGTDLRFLQGRLNLDVAYFNRVNDGLIFYVPQAASTGYVQRLANAGEMKTSGFEIALNATPVLTSNFEWNLNMNWSNPYTEVVELAPGVTSIFLSGFVDPQVRAVAGDPYRSVYGYGWTYDDAGNLLIDDDPDNAIMDGFPFSDPNERALGSVDPDWVAGITNSFTFFKNITLSALLDIKSGGLMWNGTKGAMYYFGTHGDTESRGETRVWDGVYGHYDANGDIAHYNTPLDETSGEVAGSGGENTTEVVVDEDWYWWSGEGSGFTGPAEPYIEETSWVRLREVTLSYRLPKNILANTPLRNLEIYYTGYNLWLDTPYTGVDPETSLVGNNNGQGIDYFNNPGLKSHTFGVRVGF